MMISRKSGESITVVEFDWNREGLEAAKPVLGPWPLINVEMVGKAIGKL